MRASTILATLLAVDPIRWHALGLVMSLRLPDGWIGAGFVRNAVWDYLHGREASPPRGDIDVVWFDPGQADPSIDQSLEDRLHALEPTLAWSVKNQARMHTRNSDPPYSSTADAIGHWPETATAVAAHR